LSEKKSTRVIQFVASFEFTIATLSTRLVGDVTGVGLLVSELKSNIWIVVRDGSVVDQETEPSALTLVVVPTTVPALLTAVIR
jgi:hypothetical protein